jgi:hypothetical protein
MLVACSLPVGSIVLAAQPSQPGEHFPANAQMTKYEGSLGQVLINPMGQADGLLLSDGIEVHFPPHLSAQLVALASPGDKLTLIGFKNGPVFVARTITNGVTTKSVELTPPPPFFMPPSMLGASRPVELSRHGKINYILHAPDGSVSGFVLCDQTIVRNRNPVLFSTLSTLKPGQYVTASGMGTLNNLGCCIDAQSVSLDDKSDRKQ